jgi:hypothetical protein
VRKGNEKMKTSIEKLKEYGFCDLSHLVGLSLGYSEILGKALEENITLGELIDFIAKKDAETLELILKC